MWQPLSALLIHQYVSSRNSHTSRTRISASLGRMDLVITDSDLNAILADVTIAHPNPSENQIITSTMLQPEHFPKHTKYGQATTILGARFISLVLVTYGNLHSAFSSFLGKLSTALFRREPNSDPDKENSFKQRLKQQWVNKISVSLQQSNAHAVQNH